MSATKEELAKIKLLALDVDGVLTDGSINIGATGENFKTFNAKDGLGISCALRNGLEIAVITGRKSEIVHRRCEELGITILREGVADKQVELLTLISELGLTRAEVAYMGDDLNDLPAFKVAGICCAPADATAEAWAKADIVTRSGGGKGAVREIIEMILAASGAWQKIIAAYANAGQGDQQ